MAVEGEAKCAGRPRNGDRLGRGRLKLELRSDLDPDVACYVFIGALEIVITSLVLDLIKIEEKAPSESEYYLKVARTVVDIFLHGLAQGGGR